MFEWEVLYALNFHSLTVSIIHLALYPATKPSETEAPISINQHLEFPFPTDILSRAHITAALPRDDSDALGIRVLH